MALAEKNGFKLSVWGSLSLHYHELIRLLLFIHGLAFPMAFPGVSLATSMGLIGLCLQEKPSLPHMRTFGVSLNTSKPSIFQERWLNVCAGKLEDSNSNPNTHVNAKYTSIL